MSSFQYKLNTSNSPVQRRDYLNYNIYLNSPQLAINANRKKYYNYVIQNNYNDFNRKFSNYKPSYYSTSYKRIFYPAQIIIPY